MQPDAQVVIIPREGKDRPRGTARSSQAKCALCLRGRSASGG